MSYEYIYVPLGLLFVMIAWCYKMNHGSADSCGNYKIRRRRVQRPGTVSIPSQFESPTSPIITPDDGEERPHDFPPAYVDPHQWQQQQMMQPQQVAQQQQPQQDMYAKAMQGRAQQLPSSSEVASAAAPTPANPPAPGNQQVTNMAPLGYQQFVNPAPQISAANQGTNDPASSGMLLDVTSLPRVSAYHAPLEPANKGL